MRVAGSRAGKKTSWCFKFEPAADNSPPTHSAGFWTEAVICLGLSESIFSGDWSQTTEEAGIYVDVW